MFDHRNASEYSCTRAIPNRLADRRTVAAGMVALLARPMSSILKAGRFTMPRPGRIDAYIHALMKRARLECADSVVAATLPDAFGMVAMGATEQACLDDLHARLEDWVRGSLAEGETLPVIDGLDLNHMEAPASANEQTPSAGTRSRRFFEDGAQLETALSGWERECR